MNNKLSVAIIGAGQIAGGFDRNKINDDGGIYTHINAYRTSSLYNVECVFDSDQERALDFQQYWGISRCAASLDEICNSFFDVISVCTPDASHYEIIKKLLTNKCCRGIFAEKPLALSLEEIDEISSLSHEQHIPVVMNFQRRFDNVFARVRKEIQQKKMSVLAVNAYYMKGLDHIGIAMIDTLRYLCGNPLKVTTYNRIYNQEIGDYSYEFIMFYDGFNITVKSTDSLSFRYCYHIFEIDLLFSDRRVLFKDNSKQCDTRGLADYAYSGVKVLDEGYVRGEETDYRKAILTAVEYIYNVIERGMPHEINTPQSSFNNNLVAEAVKRSFEKGQEIIIEEITWKR